MIAFEVRHGFALSANRPTLQVLYLIKPATYANNRLGLTVYIINDTPTRSTHF
jgi:hypothetical protein